MQRSPTSTCGLFSPKGKEDNSFSMIEQLKEPSCAYKVEVMGSDPKIRGLNRYRSKIEEKFAVIGVSGARTIEIACKLSSRTSAPKIVIFDNSIYAMYFWKLIKNIARISDDSQSFIENFNKYYNNIKWQVIFDLDERLIDINAYFMKLFGKYNYDFVRSVISNSDFISQALENKKPLMEVKKVINETLGINSIVMYSSNVISVFRETYRLTNNPLANFFDDIKSNIDSMNPDLHIFVDAYCTKVYIVNPSSSQRLFASTSSSAAASAAVTSSAAVSISSASGSALLPNAETTKPATVNKKDEDSASFGGLRKGFLL